MSVAYRSWEVTSGPIVGFNMAIQSNVCATADALLSEAPTYCNNTVLSHEGPLKAVPAGTDVSKGFIFQSQKAHSPQDTVIRGFASLSLHSQSQLQAGSPSKDCETSPSYESSNKSLEVNCSIPLASSGTNLCSFAACAGGYQTCYVSNPQKSIYHDGSGFKGFEDVSCHVPASQPHSDSSDTQRSISCNSFWVATTNFIALNNDYRDVGFYDFPKHTLEAVIEDTPFEENITVSKNDEFEVDALSASSTSSVSSLSGLPVDGSGLLGEEFPGVEEFEAQSAFKGSSTFTRASSPPRKGLSRFYAGKSRSFSCLGDAMSMKDLAKPENPYAKKRRCLTGYGLNTGHPQHPPLQKGAATISKKGLHSGKSTLALAVTMSAMEDGLEREDNYQSSLKALRSGQKSPLTSRSYSLSDLQRVSEHQVSRH